MTAKLATPKRQHKLSALRVSNGQPKNGTMLLPPLTFKPATFAAHLNGSNGKKPGVSSKRAANGSTKPRTIFKQARFISDAELRKRKKPRLSPKELLLKLLEFRDRELTQVEELHANDCKAATTDLIGQLRSDLESPDKNATNALSKYLGSRAGKRALAVHKAAIVLAKNKTR
jgi:hypothetical protein